MMKLSRSRRASTALVFGVTFLGVIVITSVQITRSLISTSAALTRSHWLLGQISLTRALLVQVDEAVDAYVLTGRAETLVPYEAAREELGGVVDELARQLAEERLGDAEALADLTKDKLALAAELVKVRSTLGFDAARRAFLDPRREEVVRRVTALLTTMSDQVRAATEHRAQGRAFRAQIEVVVVVLGGVLSFVLVAFAVHMLRREISDRRRAERAVEENAALLQSVTDGTADLVFLKDLDGRFRMVNPAFAHSLEATPDQLLGRFDREVLPPPEPDADPRGSDTSVVRDGRPVSFEETRIIGGYARTFLSTKALQRNADGQPIGIIGIARDITDRIRAEAELRDSEQRFRALSTASPTGIWRCDPRGRCTYTNPQWQRMSGLSHESAHAVRRDHRLRRHRRRHHRAAHGGGEPAHREHAARAPAARAAGALRHG
ncbi:MAG: PAS domain S-box protein [Deltaproteobacteria bacterium]|nr:PAS domain S-box protein [Deltaproteobacteria bacterium]